MTNKHQEIKNELKEEFFRLLNLVRGKIQKDDPNLLRFEEIIQQEKINPSQMRPPRITASENHSQIEKTIAI